MLTLAFRHDIGPDLRYLIAKVSGAPVHVAMLFDDTCIEAVFSGVRAIPREARLEKGVWTLVPTPLTREHLAKAFDFAQAQIGKPYDLRGSAFSWWFGRTETSNNDKWNCSEIAAQVLMEGGVNLQPSRAAHYTPRKLYDVLKPWRVE